ncbi:MAG: VanZ family protein [Rhodobacterales bacterium]
MHNSPLKSVKSSPRRTIALGLTAILAMLIAYLTLTPVSAPDLFSGVDKIYHIIAFAALLIPSAYLYRPVLYYTLPCAILFGGMIEIIQPYVNRTGDMADFAADIIGTILGVAIGLVLSYIFRPRVRV